MTTALQHPLVREYLARLDAALLKLAPAQAVELRDQILAHLDDAIAPDASDDEVRSELRLLGGPDALVGDAIGPARRGHRRIRKRTWAALGVVALILIGSVAFAAPWFRAGPLVCDCAYGWTYRADGASAVQTSADGHSQTTVRIRPNATQGFDVQLTNRTRFTQTILGWGLKSADGSTAGPFAARSFTMRLSPDGDAAEAGFPQRFIDEQEPVSIKPNGFRTLSVTWASASLPCIGSGVSVSVDSISLRVRVGWLTRTEVIALPSAFAIIGPSGTCPLGQ